jgi:hypothetical protein
VPLARSGRRREAVRRGLGPVSCGRFRWTGGLAGIDCVARERCRPFGRAAPDRGRVIQWSEEARPSRHQANTPLMLVDQLALESPPSRTPGPADRAGTNYPSHGAANDFRRHRWAAPAARPEAGIEPRWESPAPVDQECRTSASACCRGPGPVGLCGKGRRSGNCSPSLQGHDLACPSSHTRRGGLCRAGVSPPASLLNRAISSGGQAPGPGMLGDRGRARRGSPGFDIRSDVNMGCE